MKGSATVTAVLIGIAIASWTLFAGQLPLSPVRDRGQTITPVYEGWYPNPDGTFSMSFGYFNRNADEELDIPVGSDNRMEPGGPDLGQPTHFRPRRRRGVFAVTVPADFGNKEIVWTLTFRGESNSIPGHLHRDWMLDAIGGEAGGNTPPTLQLEPGGTEGRGPRGVTAGPRTATVGQPVTLDVWVSDDGVTRPRRPRASTGRFDDDDEEPALVTLTWHPHQGPGEVTFADAELDVQESGSQATTTATFSEPGDYIVRVTAVDASRRSPTGGGGTAIGAGGSQCCWSNGFVPVTVTP